MKKLFLYTLRLLLVFVFLAGICIPIQPVTAGGTVGTGTPGSCTEAAFDAALSGGGEVTFNCGSEPYTIVLTSQKNITVNTTIDGGGKISLSGGDSIRLFYVSSGATLNLYNLTLMNGSSSQGGAINNDGYVVILNSSLVNNSAPGMIGGAIYNYGTLTITGSTLSGNTASAGMSGAIQNDGMLTINHSNLSNNFVGMAGGAIGNDGVLVIDGSTFEGNRGPIGGGAIYNSGPLTIFNSSFLNNTASSGYGGGINNVDTLTIASSTFYTNTASNGGGGIFTHDTTTVNLCTFRGNRAGTGGMGGALYNDYYSDLSVEDSMLENNSAPGGQGGGIYNTGNLFMVKDTLTGNSASSGMGGGVANAISGTLIVENSTFSDNFGGTAGGGIISGGDATVTNCTFYNNTAGGLVNGYYKTINVKNTIIANNTVYNCSGEITSLGYNLEDANTCTFTSTGDLIQTNPLLGPLADNGGPTLTHALMIGSPAINAGTNIGCPPTDQRGIVRPLLGTCDIGAFEFAEEVFLPLIKK
jgi:hypothetical protein